MRQSIGTKEPKRDNLDDKLLYDKEEYSALITGVYFLVIDRMAMMRWTYMSNTEHSRTRKTKNR